uniref:ARAD1D26246p n=1 Tax=Blastobotrys adeninivorans TaxID=409370 RepID=A0A060TGV4_BLAAD
MNEPQFGERTVNPVWRKVDDYVNKKTGATEFDWVVEESLKAGLPAIAVSPAEAKLLYLYALSIGAKRILEVGTLGGYSAVWLAKALPEGGKVVTLEYEPLHAKVAKANIERAGFSDKVEVIVGNAHDTLRSSQVQSQAPFDMVFIDAEKSGYPDYFDGALEVCRKGAVLVIDNAIRRGSIADPKNDTDEINGVRGVYDRLERGLAEGTGIQTVSGKVYDGFIFAIAK